MAVIYVLVIKQQSDINWHVWEALIGGNPSLQGDVAVHRLEQDAAGGNQTDKQHVATEGAAAVFRRHGNQDI